MPRIFMRASEDEHVAGHVPMGAVFYTLLLHKANAKTSSSHAQSAFTCESVLLPGVDCMGSARLPCRCEV